jgi:hypothetical protein
MQPSSNKLGRKSKRFPASLLSPDLIEALVEYAAAEDLPVPTLVALLINEALGRRLHGGQS